MAETNLYVKSVQPFDTGKAPKSNSTNTIISESMDQWIIQAIWVYGIWYLSLEQTDQTVTASCLCQTKHMLLPQDIAINTQITRCVLHFSIFSQAAFFLSHWRFLLSRIGQHSPNGVQGPGWILRWFDDLSEPRTLDETIFKPWNVDDDTYDR